jgi:hypothetical protein
MQLHLGAAWPGSAQADMPHTATTASAAAAAGTTAAAPASAKVHEAACSCV